LHNKPKAKVHPGHKVTEEEEGGGGGGDGGGGGGGGGEGGEGEGGREVEVGLDTVLRTVFLPLLTCVSVQKIISAQE
jgi:hypothetical protein